MSLGAVVAYELLMTKISAIILAPDSHASLKMQKLQKSGPWSIGNSIISVTQTQGPFVKGALGP